MESGFDQCEQDLSHTGYIQSFGAVVQIAVENGRVVTYSRNIDKFLPTKRVRVGACADSIEEGLHDYLQSIPKGGDGHRPIGDLTLITHRMGHLWTLQFEPSAKTDRTKHNKGLVEDNKFSIRQMRGKTLSDLQEFSGFERVLLYEFLPDGSGAVTAERYLGDGDRYLGLRYPATDIPKVARDLYLRTPFRYIYDVRAEPVPLVYDQSTGETPPDLSLSFLREVSPFHLRYLSNMGVGCAFSIPLISDGKLAGLFSLHHPKPKMLGHRDRQNLVQVVADYTSFLKQSRLNDRMNIIDRNERELEIFVRAVLQSPQLEEDQCRPILSLFDATAMARFHKGTWSSTGLLNETDDLDPIVQGVIDQGSGLLFSESVLEISDDLEHLVSAAAGCVAIWCRKQNVLGPTVLLFFKPEVIQEVTWGSKVSIPPGEENPVNSFGQWKEMMRNRCEPWSNQSKVVATILLSKLQDKKNA